MRPLIEFCMHNYELGTEKVKKKLEESPDYDILEKDCLGHCEQCMTPYALVEGDIIEADDPDTLLEKIEEKIKELQS